MTGNITWDVVSLIVAAIVGAFACWWRIEWRVEKAEDAAGERMDKIEKQLEGHTDQTIAVSKDLADYKLDASQRFASHEHLKEVEVRLTTSIDRLTNRVEQLPARLAEEFARVAAGTRTPRRRT